MTQQYFAEGVHLEGYYDVLILRPELAEYYRSNAIDAEKVLKEFEDYERKLGEHRAEPQKPDKADKEKEEKEKEKPFKVRTVRRAK